MPMRLSGLITGMDTEAIVGQLMSAQSMKKTKVVQAKTKLEWKQTAWTDLNKKLTSFYNTQATKMRLSGSYKLKKATVSDTSKASVNANTSAVNGNYTMEVERIATSQYLTGAKTSLSSTSQKLVEADSTLAGKTIHVETSTGTRDIEITADTKVSDFVSELQKAGLNASYDTSQKRFFISSKDTGAAQAFSITTATVSNEETTRRDALKTAVGYDSLSSADKSKVDGLITTLRDTGNSGASYDEALQSLAKISYNSKNQAAIDGATTYAKAKLYSDYYADALTEAEGDKDIIAQFYEVDDDGNAKLDASNKKIPKTDTNALLPDDYDAAVKKKADEIATKYANEHFSTDSTGYANAYQDGSTAVDLTSLSAVAKEKFYPSGSVSEFDGMNGITEDNVKSSITDAVYNYASLSDTERANSLASGDLGLSKLGIADMDFRRSDDGVVTYTYDQSVGMALVEAGDSSIILNGAKLTSSTSTVNANGLEINLISTTAPNSPINFSVSNDIDAAYDNIKKALKEYNTLLKEMNTLYNAESSKGYEPLTSEEKEALSDKEVEEWEKKIKDSLLRNDSTLGSIINGMRDAMMRSTTVNGVSYALSSFGIMTSTDYTERGLLHIYGDADDEVYSGQDDKLKKALAENPDDTIAALTNIFEGLRSTMMNQMSAKQGVSSALTFYNDLTMKDEMSNYKTQIKTWEDKLATMEESYYKKFTAMESAMAKMQSQQSSLGGLLGMG